MKGTGRINFSKGGITFFEVLMKYPNKLNKTAGFLLNKASRA
jgi:hypothetical protein